MKKNFVNFGLFCALFLSLRLVATEQHSWSGMSVINSSDDPVLIKYSRAHDNQLFLKLVEPGEALPFGSVGLALVHGSGTMSHYTAPAETQIYPTEGVQPIKSDLQAIIRIKGAKDSGMIRTGTWDLEVMSSGTLLKLDPESFEVPHTKSILEVFPTVRRTVVQTPRYILGLPTEAGVSDAIEAENILTSKWLMLKDLDAPTTKIVLNIVHILNEARKAFEAGNPDVFLKIEPNILYSKQDLKEKKVMDLTTY